MPSRRLLWYFLLALHLPALAAEWVAPYDVAEQTRTLSFAPPTRLHFFDGEGRFHPRPFVYALRRDPEEPGRFVEDLSAAYPVRWFVPGEPRSLGSLRVETRLFGTESPTGIRLWGTDRYGRDLFSRTLYGARLSLFAGIFAAALGVLLGLGVGSVAALAGGPTDALLMRAAELTVSLPWLYLLIALRAFLPLRADPTMIFLVTVGLVGALAWARPARLVRAGLVSAKQEEFVLAARGFGASQLHLLFRHLLPQTRDTLVTQWAILVPKCIMAEVTLAFFGLGVSDPTPSLGNLLSVLTEAHGAAARGWMFAPAVALGLAVLGYHLLAEGLQRDQRL